MRRFAVNQRDAEDGRCGLLKGHGIWARRSAPSGSFVRHDAPFRRRGQPSDGFDRHRNPVAAKLSRRRNPVTSKCGCSQAGQRKPRERMLQAGNKPQRPYPPIRCLMKLMHRYFPYSGGNTILGVVALASCALAVDNAEQAASRSKPACLMFDLRGLVIRGQAARPFERSLLR